MKVELKKLLKLKVELDRQESRLAFAFLGLGIASVALLGGAAITRLTK